jgi:hypothetical protein
MVKDVEYFDIGNYKPINPQELLDKYTTLRIQNSLYLKAVMVLEESGCWPPYKLELFPLINEKMGPAQPNMIIKYSLVFEEGKNADEVREAFRKILSILYAEAFGIKDEIASFSLNISPLLPASKN